MALLRGSGVLNTNWLSLKKKNKTSICQAENRATTTLPSRGLHVNADELSCIFIGCSMMFYGMYVLYNEQILLLTNCYCFKQLPFL